MQAVVVIRMRYKLLTLRKRGDFNPNYHRMSSYTVSALDILQTNLLCLNNCYIMYVLNAWCSCSPPEVGYAIPPLSQTLLYTTKSIRTIPIENSNRKRILLMHSNYLLIRLELSFIATM